MRTPLILSLLLLASCGFTPLHGESYRQGLSTDLSSVQVVVDHSRQGQLLEAEIEDGVNPAAHQAEKRYTLRISLTQYEIPLFINLDGTSGRGDIDYRSHYKLTRNSDGATLDEGNLNRVSSFNTSDTADYASFVSIEDAKRRGILELAQGYKLRLANLLPRLNEQQP